MLYSNDVGFNGFYIFILDKNECLDKSAKCNVNALCTNTLGSYRCRCKNGYTGDGETCQGNLVRFSYDVIFEYDRKSKENCSIV